MILEARRLQAVSRYALARALSLLATSPMLVLGALACGESQAERVGGPARLEPRDLTNVQTQQPRTLHDRFREVAGRVPGFTGVFIDDSGRLTVSTMQSSVSPAMRREVEGLLTTYGRSHLARVTPRLHRVKYDFITLDDIHRRALDAGLATLDGVTGGGVDEVAGRVLVTVEDEQTRSAVLGLFVALGTPNDAVMVIEAGEAHETLGL